MVWQEAKMSIKVYVDTNIFLNSILQRDKNISKRILYFLANNNFEIILNDVSIINIHYFIQKDLNFNRAKEYISILLEEYTIVSAYKKLLQQALHSNFKDFEDGVQYFCAKEAEADFIISNDKNGFRNSKITVITADDFYSNYMISS